MCTYMYEHKIVFNKNRGLKHTHCTLLRGDAMSCVSSQNCHEDRQKQDLGIPMLPNMGTAKNLGSLSTEIGGLKA